MAAKFILIITLLNFGAADPLPDPDLKVDVRQQVDTFCGGGDCLTAEINQCVTKDGQNSALFNEIQTGVTDIMETINEVNNSVTSDLDMRMYQLESRFSSLEDDINSLKEDLNKCCSDIDRKLQTLQETLGCPKDFFMGPGSEQCFKFINTRVNWENADSTCLSMGLVLAHPYNPVAVRSYLLTRYGNGKNAWIGGKGDGTNIIWQRDGIPLSQDSSLWLPGRSTPVTSEYCLAMTINASEEKKYPIEPLYTSKCIYGWYPLCELIKA